MSCIYYLLIKWKTFGQHNICFVGNFTLICLRITKKERYRLSLLIGEIFISVMLWRACRCKTANVKLIIIIKYNKRRKIFQLKTERKSLTYNNSPVNIDIKIVIFSGIRQAKYHHSILTSVGRRQRSG